MSLYIWNARNESYSSIDTFSPMSSYQLLIMVGVCVKNIYIILNTCTEMPQFMNRAAYMLRRNNQFYILDHNASERLMFHY